jgi:hypothetical protein
MRRLSVRALPASEPGCRCGVPSAPAGPARQVTIPPQGYRLHEENPAASLLTQGLRMGIVPTSERAEYAVEGGLRCPLWVKSDIEARQSDVRSTPESGHCRATVRCPLCAISGHQPTYSSTSSSIAKSTVTLSPSIFRVPIYIFTIRPNRATHYPMSLSSQNRPVMHMP